MQRVPEPELMDDDEQAEAYHRADFSEAHDLFVTLFRNRFGAVGWESPVLDLGCGTADVTLRFAAAFPFCQIDGLDGAEAMLTRAKEAVARLGFGHQVRLFRCRLPEMMARPRAYGAVISNSLLHHLSDPMVLWSAVRAYGRAGAPVLVMDLVRPATPDAALALVDRYAAAAPDVLRRDFHNSLIAAYSESEVLEQLDRAGLAMFAVERVSDRHIMVSGRIPPAR